MDNREKQTKAVFEDVWIPTVCELCNRGPDLMRVHRVNGIIVNIEGNLNGEGFQELTKAKGSLCSKAYGLIQKTYNPHRIKAPLKRTNPEKGRGIDPKWVEISWDQALDSIEHLCYAYGHQDGDHTALPQGGAAHNSDPIQQLASDSPEHEIKPTGMTARLLPFRPNAGCLTLGCRG